MPTVPEGLHLRSPTFRSVILSFDSRNARTVAGVLLPTHTRVVRCAGASLLAPCSFQPELVYPPRAHVEIFEELFHYLHNRKCIVRGDTVQSVVSRMSAVGSEKSYLVGRALETLCDDSLCKHVVNLLPRVVALRPLVHRDCLYRATTHDNNTLVGVSAPTTPGFGEVVADYLRDSFVIRRGVSARKGENTRNSIVESVIHHEGYSANVPGATDD